MADDTTSSQKLGAEAIGTFVLVFFGCGSAVYSSQVDAPSTVTTIGLAFGISIMVMVYAFGRVSGGHFNPAVSVGAAMGGRISWGQVPLYVAAQLAGAIVGALVLFTLMQGFDGYDSTGHMGENFYGDQGTGYAWWAAFLLEVLLTALFVWVILAVTDIRNEHPSLAPLAIGLTLAAAHFVAIPATGTSMNPARSIGPALFAGTDAIVQLWLFILAPLIGGAVAGLTYPLLFGHGTDPVIGSGFRFPRPARATVPAYAAMDAYQQEWNQETGTGTGLGTGSGDATGTAGEASGAADHGWGTEPIIQDGWQWDPVAQEWFPAPQPTQAAPAAPATTEPVEPAWTGEPAAPEQQWQQPYEHQEPIEAPPSQEWPPADEGRPGHDDGPTQVRPPL
ncbi:MAG: MIP family channel protein [Ornithinibacter sp.]